MKEFRDRVAVVTGAASGIGRGIARACAREGMRVVVADVDEAGLGALAEELRAGAAEVVVQPTDVRHGEAVDALARAALDAFGAVHLVFNNAGVLLGGLSWERTEDDWRWVMDVNLFGVVNGLRTFVPILLEQGEPAHVVNTASVGGFMIGPFLAPYLVSKHAVVALSEAAHQELATLDTPVGLSVLCPGPIATGIARSERVRPSDRPDTAALRSETEKSYDEALRAGIESGMAPDEVGRIVFDALREGRFWIYTHPIPAEMIRARAESIIAGGDSVPGLRVRGEGPPGAGD